MAECQYNKLKGKMLTSLYSILNKTKKKQESNTISNKIKWDRRSSLVAHWLLVPGDYGSNPCGREKCSCFVFES